VPCVLIQATRGHTMAGADRRLAGEGMRARVSGRGSLAATMKTADLGDLDDPASAGRLYCARERRMLVQREVRSPPMRVDAGLLEVAVHRPLVPATGRRLG
jgi:hypothetical protein